MDGGRAELSGRIANNERGIHVGYGGSLLIQDGIVENNSGDGVYLVGASALKMSRSIIRGNGRSGINILDHSVARFMPPGSSQVINNGGAGLKCEPAPATAVINGVVGTVSGNAEGQNLCPATPWM
ncbi:MAG: right-handed parallel beta-helix repeat-containing protein [Acidobacteriia bacterium]|nr:right-handed parallel beta-helix repeat-containing protein [Terriglobia bacterium]